jgi:hypothetical protein
MTSTNLNLAALKVQKIYRGYKIRRLLHAAQCAFSKIDQKMSFNWRFLPSNELKLVRPCCKRELSEIAPSLPLESNSGIAYHQTIEAYNTEELWLEQSIRERIKVISRRVSG